MAVPEGRAVYTGGAWQYEFFYTDHLGNTRVAFRANGNQLVKTSETAFDPWGVVLRGAGQVNAYQNRFEFQNKEKESTFGLNRISLGARTVNPTTGGMDGVDPLAEKMPSYSPFSFSFNNPVRFIDPDGREPFDWVRLKDGGLAYDVSVTNQAQATAKYGTDSYIVKSALLMNASGQQLNLNANGTATSSTMLNEVTVLAKAGTGNSATDLAMGVNDAVGLTGDLCANR